MVTWNTNEENVNLQHVTDEGDKDIAIYHKRHSLSALMMPEVLFGDVNFQVPNLKFSVLKQRIYI